MSPAQQTGWGPSVPFPSQRSLFGFCCLPTSSSRQAPQLRRGYLTRPPPPDLRRPSRLRGESESAPCFHQTLSVGSWALDGTAGTGAPVLIPGRSTLPVPWTDYSENISFFFCCVPRIARSRLLSDSDDWAMHFVFWGAFSGFTVRTLMVGLCAWAFGGKGGW